MELVGKIGGDEGRKLYERYTLITFLSLDIQDATRDENVHTSLYRRGDLIMFLNNSDFDLELLLQTKEGRRKKVRLPVDSFFATDTVLLNLHKVRILKTQNISSSFLKYREQQRRGKRFSVHGYLFGCRGHKIPFTTR